MDPTWAQVKSGTRLFSNLKAWLARRFKKEDEIHLLCTQLALHLEEFADDCYDVSHDEGEDDPDGYLYARRAEPALDMDSFKPDWLLLSHDLRYQLVELSARVKRMRSFLSSSANEAIGPDKGEYFIDRQEQHVEMGIHVVGLAQGVRQYGKLPDDGRAAKTLAGLKERSAVLTEHRAKRQRYSVDFNAWLQASTSTLEGQAIKGLPAHL